MIARRRMRYSHKVNTSADRIAVLELGVWAVPHLLLGRVRKPGSCYLCGGGVASPLRWGSVPPLLRRLPCCPCWPPAPLPPGAGLLFLLAAATAASTPSGI